MNKAGRQKYDSSSQYVSIADFEELMKTNQQLAIAYVPPDDISKKIALIEADQKPQSVMSARVSSSQVQNFQQNQVRPQLNAQPQFLHQSLQPQHPTQQMQTQQMSNSQKLFGQQMPLSQQKPFRQFGLAATLPSKAAPLIPDLTQKQNQFSKKRPPTPPKKQQVDQL